MTDDSDDFDDDEFEGFEDEPLQAKFDFVDKAAQQIVRPEWIGHPPWNAPDLSNSDLKTLSSVCKKLKAGGTIEELVEWTFSRMSDEASSGGKLEPVGARIYGLLMLMVVLGGSGVEPFASSPVPHCSSSKRSVYSGPDKLCEATVIELAECTLPTDDPDRPYFLSHAAADRLEHRCLAPIEWYRLVVRHGTTHYYLWSDFYDNDGRPLQAMFFVPRSRGAAIPCLNDVRDNLKTLVDFAFFNLQLDRTFTQKSEVMAAIGAFGRRAVEAELNSRIGRIPANWIEQLCWRICIELGYVDESRLRHRWAAIRKDAEALRFQVSELAADSIQIVGSAATIDLVIDAADELRKLSVDSGRAEFISPFGIAYALRERMGSDVLLELVIALMERVPADRKADEALHAFYQFRDERVLDWIEKQAFEPVDYQWGTAAAVNAMSWDRVKKWLGRGRPLSLIALDAMKNCRGFDPEDAHMSGVFRDYSPKISGNPSAAEIRDVLATCVKSDSDQRVTKAVSVILEHSEKIFERIST